MLGTEKPCWNANGALTEFFSGFLSGQKNAFSSQQQKQMFQILLPIRRHFFVLVKALKSEKKCDIKISCNSAFK